MGNKAHRLTKALPLSLTSFAPRGSARDASRAANARTFNEVRRARGSVVEERGMSATGAQDLAFPSRTLKCPPAP